jgi:hypothetical protein
MGFSFFISEIACRCIFDPIKARLASLCSKNGMSPVPTEIIWLGAVFIKFIFSSFTFMNCWHFSAKTSEFVIFSSFPFSFVFKSPEAKINCFSCSDEMKNIPFLI